MTKATHSRLVVLGLIILSLVPMAAGVSRLVGLASNPVLTPDNARFVESPLPVVLHIIGATLYSILGAFQFSSTLLQRRPSWHRLMGRLLLPCGLLAAGSGLWMTLAYRLPETLQGPLLYGFRLAIGSAMVLALLLGLAAILRRKVASHKAWMIRSYAIGQGAGTQVFTNLPWILLFGFPSVGVYEWLMIAGWAINLAVGEWVIRRPRPVRPAYDRSSPASS